METNKVTKQPRTVRLPVITGKITISDAREAARDYAVNSGRFVGKDSPERASRRQPNSESRRRGGPAKKKR